MKRRKTISQTCLLAVVLLLGCAKDDNLFHGPYFVSFTNDATSVKESVSKPVNVEIHIGGPLPDQDVVVHYKISGSAREGIDYTIVGTRGTVTIAKGTSAADIEVQLIDNANNILRSQDIIFTIQDVVSNQPLQVGFGESAIGKSFTFTILDDCILGGTYTGSTTDKFFIPLTGITITSDNCEEYLLSNYDIEIFTFPDTRSLTFEDNGDNTLTIPPQEDSTLPSDLSHIQGSGTVNPIDGTITMTVQLLDFDGQPEFTFTLTRE